MDPTPSETVQLALEALLAAVAKAADDLRLFHDTVARAQLAPLPPFPRVAVLTADRIVDRLKSVDEDLRQVLVALGLPEAPP